MTNTHKPKSPSLIKPDTPLQFVKGAGPRIADILKSKNLRTARDLVSRLPRSFQDNRSVTRIADMVNGQAVMAKAFVLKKSIIPLRGRRSNMYEIIVGDSEGGQIACKFFKIPYKKWFNELRAGETVEVRGKPSLYRGRLEFHHPQIFPARQEEESAPLEEKDLILPLYTEIEGLSQYKVRSLLREIFARMDLEEWAKEEWLPKWLKDKCQLTGLTEALKGIHQPKDYQADDCINFKTPFHKRLIFDEFFELQCYFALKNQGWKSARAPQIPADPKKIPEMERHLPFYLTQAQKKALKMIFKDLNSPHPMHRLLQGDVGCGKTAVALLAALACAQAKKQTAIMAPTEILAHQHYKNAQKFLEPFGLKVEKLTGKMKAGKKRTVSAVLKSGFCDVCIGTQALIQEGVEFYNLALVIIDEQHRFGTHQRALLKSKGAEPHFLVMTATPIPRSLSLAIYGDLELSIIDEMPPGRLPITTKRVFPKGRKEVFDFVREQALKGRQAYVVYPLVEESETLDLKNAVHQYEKLKSHYSDVRWGLLTGRMSPEEKQSIMERFLKGLIQVLVSTTVIEVGVDVANANIMVIENAERFGLSQMHQLRGRVGRGRHKSWCIVALGERFSKEASERAYIMQTCSDGFKIAEKDLEIRGPGEFLGGRQSGLPGFKNAHLIRDAKILALARGAAGDLIAKDPSLKQQDHQKIKERFQKLARAIRPG